MRMTKCGKPHTPAATLRGSPNGSFCGALWSTIHRSSGGGGIRTHEALARPTVFKTAPFDRSGTPPTRIVTDAYEGWTSAGAP